MNRSPVRFHRGRELVLYLLAVAGFASGTAAQIVINEIDYGRDVLELDELGGVRAQLVDGPKSSAAASGDPFWTRLESGLTSRSQSGVTAASAQMTK